MNKRTFITSDFDITIEEKKVVIVDTREEKEELDVLCVFKDEEKEHIVVKNSNNEIERITLDQDVVELNTIDGRLKYKIIDEVIE